MQLCSKSEQAEPADEHQKVRLAVGAVLYEVGEALLYPIFRVTSHLIPEWVWGSSVILLASKFPAILVAEHSGLLNNVRHYT